MPPRPRKSLFHYAAMAGLGLSLVFSQYYVLWIFPHQQSPDSTSWIPALTGEVSQPLLPPIAVVEEWKRHHSLQAIHAHPHNRSYIVVSYSCPRQFGIQSCDILSGFLQAIVSNRTLLVYYGNLGNWTTRGINHPSVCDRILQRHDWVPEYHALAPNLPKRVPVQIPARMYDRTNKTVFFEAVMQGKGLNTAFLSTQRVLEPARFPRTSNVTEVYEGLLVLTNPVAARFISSAYGLGENFHQDPLVQQLYSRGVSFLYGMLFDQLFDFTAEFKDTLGKHEVRAPPKEEISIGLHSRHTSPKDDGSNVKQEVACLDSILHHFQEKQSRRTFFGSSSKKNASSSLPCSLYIMSDRPATLQNLGRAAKQRDCQVIQTQHTQSPAHHNSVDEHGPFAGAGYFRDLLVVSQAQSAYISLRRSSSALVDELIEHRRHVEAWENGRTVPPPLVRCSMKEGRVLRPRQPRRNHWHDKVGRFWKKRIVGA